jgi:hypothetical protein
MIIEEHKVKGHHRDAIKRISWFSCAQLMPAMQTLRSTDTRLHSALAKANVERSDSHSPLSTKLTHKPHYAHP